MKRAISESVSVFFTLSADRVCSKFELPLWNGRLSGNAEFTSDADWNSKRELTRELPKIYNQPYFWEVICPLTGDTVTT